MAEEYEWTEVTVGFTRSNEKVAEQAAKFGMTEEAYLIALSRAADGVPVENWPVPVGDATVTAARIASGFDDHPTIGETLIAGRR